MTKRTPKTEKTQSNKTLDRDALEVVKGGWYTKYVGRSSDDDDHNRLG